MTWGAEVDASILLGSPTLMITVTEGEAEEPVFEVAEGVESEPVSKPALDSAEEMVSFGTSHPLD